MRALSFVFLFASMSASAANAPDWLREISAQALPTYPAKTPAAVLFHEESVVLEPSGKQIRTTRYAVKILNRDGASEAAFYDYYYSDTGKSKDMKAWLISASGKTKEYGKAEINDVAVASGLYDEFRARSINAASGADPGSVFGVESTIEQSSIFSQFTYDFQDDLPVLSSRFVLTVPAGWRAEAKLFRSATAEALSPEVSGSTYRWQLTKLDPWQPEPDSPRRFGLRPRLVINTFPPSGGDALAGHFHSWRDVSIWKSKLVDKPAEVTPQIEAFVQKTIAQSSSEWDRIEALAEAAQKIRYVSVQLNLSRGGGYTPHAASFVHSRGYGDCKDKSNYLRTLLKAAGIDAYPVVIHSGDPNFARSEWPSPFQFNHAILAIRVSDGVKHPAVFEFPGVGRLLLFDPTDEYVPLGSIPDHEQGSYALLLAGEKGDLFKTPATTPSDNHVSRKTKFSIDPSGRMKAVVRDSATGQMAFDSRWILSRNSPMEYTKRRERYIAQVIQGAALEKISPSDQVSSFDITYEFSVDAYAKVMQGRLMMIRPLPMPIDGLPDVSNTKRTLPLVLSASSFEEEAELELPIGFDVDELPQYEKLATEFGNYSMQIAVTGSKINIRRQFEMPSMVVQPEKYTAVREFIGQVAGSERTPIVLIRK